jgi:hypothetical protein
MTIHKVDYSKIEEASDGGILLFKVMMRLEFSLKHIGYCHLGSFPTAKVDWDRYVKERLGSTFWNKIQKDPEFQVLIQSPPKKQIVNQDGRLDWEPSAAVMSSQCLIGAVRRVRNNLFHGGKSGDPDVDRNATLYKEALLVIDKILCEDRDLGAIFSGRY